MKKNIYELLVEFEFVVDMDYAMFRLVKEKFANSILTNKDVTNLTDKKSILDALINRRDANVLDVLLSSERDKTSLYEEIVKQYELELLKYAIPYDTLPLMVTFINNAPTGVTILCKNQSQEQFIKNYNSSLNTVIIDKHDIDLSKYNAVYIKYAQDVIAYSSDKLVGKHIYLADAGFNYDKYTNVLSGLVGVLYGDLNIIKTMSLYSGIGYNLKGEQ